MTHPRRLRTVASRTGRLVGNTLAALAVLAAVAFVVPGFLGFERYVITGGSMSGTFEVGSVVFEKTVPVDELAVGDVITYLPPADSGADELVTHRIVSVRATEGGDPVFRTKGDANAAADPWKFHLGTTQPRVEFDVPLVGYAFMALADRQNRMLFIGVPAALVGVWSLLELLKALRTGNTSTENTVLPASTEQRSTEPVGV